MPHLLLVTGPDVGGRVEQPTDLSLDVAENWVPLLLGLMSR